MDKKQLILAAFSPADGMSHTPLQTQKLLFLIDREIPSDVNGPIFDFKPYNYGPFDKTVYDELNELSIEGYVDIIPQNTWQCYKLTSKGQQEGQRLFSSLDTKAKDFIKDVSIYVRSLTFAQLVSAIYKAYPEMKENSVFQDCK